MMSNKVYNVLKWFVLVGSPALSTLIFTLGSIWGIPVDKVIGSIAAITTALGVMLGISSYNYNKTSIQTEESVDTDAVNPTK